MSSRAAWAAVVARKGGAPVTRKTLPRAESAIEERLWYELNAEHKSNGTPLPTREYRFHAHRKWRFDFAWPARKVAAECEGGIWQGGRHTRGDGFQKDCEKYNAAAIEGWLVLRFTLKHVDSGLALETILKCLGEW